MMAVPPITLHLLGSFQLSQAAAENLPLPRRKTRAMLAYLATANQPHTRQALMDMFCQDTQSPARALSLLLTRVRQHLGTAVLLSQGDAIQLDLQAAWVDYAVFQQQLAGDLGQKNAPDLQTAVSLYRGEFLEGLTLPDAPEFELWLLGQRALARQLLERGLLALVQRLSQDGQFDTAVTYARQLLQHNPLLEEAYAQLIWLYAQTGQREAALNQYEQCCAHLQAELAVEPTPELQSLYDQIKAGKVGQSGSIALSTIPASISVANMAAVKTPDFVGRDSEMSRLLAVWQAVQAGTGQILLIEADAGAGKSRLVQEFAAQLRPGQALIGHCYESTMTLPFQPWQEVLTAHLAQWDDAALQKLPLFVQMYLSRLLPIQAERMDSKTAVSHPIQTGELGQLLMAIFDFLSRSPDGHSQPRLLFIDDLQWADEASLQLFSTIALRLASQPILLVGAVRWEEKENSPALQTLLHDLSRKSAHHIQLSAFSAQTIQQLMVHI